MSAWDDYQYVPDTGKAKAEPLKGKYRVIISNVEEAVSKSSGNPMLVISVRPSGVGFDVKNYVVKNDKFNQNMSRFFDAFPTVKKDFKNMLAWVGAEGGAELAPDDKGYTKIKWWLRPDETAKLPEFVGEKPKAFEFTEITEEDDSGLPF